MIVAQIGHINRQLFPRQYNYYLKELIVKTKENKKQIENVFPFLHDNMHMLSEQD